MDEQKLRQLFKNRSNCYADADDVVQAMDENCFVETVKEVLRIHNVVGRSEQLEIFKCPNCGNDWDIEKVNSCECGASVRR